MNQSICPYPGLRPFNEEESIFFKGREQQVERLVKRLEEKKFLMVNGASGDGKSSLIYAGVIPYAKAGFFKAKYNNWIVADFRPERSPLKNFTAAVCKQLKIEDSTKTEKELGYGFSALCDLYKSSSYYIDESKSEWQNADEKERKTQKRKAANLLVLVDQFEEFFTNPENYQNGIPSIESQKTVNLLLETYKLAAAHDLPIYVVCTMRSDYIGQCAAFRGLPEAIGYSQFFVPRLKRQEIEQVIEGPAALAGCCISKRLTQSLINSLTDGFDQLPILQHALNRIWKAADEGSQELDLIHLAKVGGLSSKMLSVEDRTVFQLWYDSLPDFKKQLLEKPSLSNVLNAHANELLFKENLGKLSLSELASTKNYKVIKILFQSLTNFDKGRIVRRRASVGEVLELINDDNIDLQEFNRIILDFRVEGNSFLKPYFSNSHQMLDKNAILDITHESLIRNWNLVEEWVLEQEENVQTWMEIEKPMRVWKENVKTSKWFILFSWQFSKVQKYVLPSGLYTLYNRWNKQHPVHLAWLKRISPQYNEESFKDFKNFLMQSRIVLFWIKIQPYLISAILLYFVYLTNQAKIREANEALRNQKIQKELLVKAELSASQAIKAKQEADSLKYLAQNKELKTKKELAYLIENASPIVMPGKMNVMYVGVDNPFEFAVSGFNANDVDPIVEVFPEEVRHLKCQLKKQSNGSYTLKIPKGVMGVKINALAKIGYERKMLKGNSPYFRVKSLPNPVATIYGFPAQHQFTKSDIPKMDQLFAYISNFDFEVYPEILAYTATFISNGDLKSNVHEGNKIEETLINHLKKINLGEISDTVLVEDPSNGKVIEIISNYTKIIFEDIKVKMPDNSVRVIDPIIVKVKLK